MHIESAKLNIVWTVPEQRPRSSLTMLLNGSWRSVFVECAFRDTGEDFNHGVAAILLVHVGVLDDIGSVSQETPAEEFINHNDVEELE